ncbi:MAG TPA: tyrosine-type recombinase/integrase [Ktedonobacterales bacterium]
MDHSTHRDQPFAPGTDATAAMFNPLTVTWASYHSLLKRAGLRRARFHDGRHTAASLMLEAVVPLEVVSEMLGHTTIAITKDVYGHIGEGMKHEAAAALDALLRRGVS